MCGSVQFSEQFLAEGPGTYAEDLDKGLTVMNSYRKQCADIEARRADLAAAEKLFDLPISVCKGSITSEIKHAIKHKTSPARLAHLLHNCCNPH